MSERLYDVLPEAMARAICEADGVDPDKQLCGMGVSMPVGELYPAWRGRLKQATAALNAIALAGYHIS